MIHPAWKQYAEWLAATYPVSAAASTPQDHMIYLSAPYSRVPDKEAFMRQIMTFSGQFMLAHPGQHVCSPLFNHFSLDHVPELGTDYAFWKAYSCNMLKRCDSMIVICAPGWQESTGVADEIRLATEIGLLIQYVSADVFTAVSSITEVLTTNLFPTAN